MSTRACNPSSCRYRRCSCHSSSCSSSRAPTRPVTAASLGRMPTTSVRRLISALSRSSGFVEWICTRTGDRGAYAWARHRREPVGAQANRQGVGRLLYRGTLRRIVRRELTHERPEQECDCRMRSRNHRGDAPVGYGCAEALGSALSMRSASSNADSRARPSLSSASLAHACA